MNGTAKSTRVEADVLRLIAKAIREDDPRLLEDTADAMDELAAKWEREDAAAR